MRRLFLFLLILVTCNVYGQFADTSGINTYIRTNIRDKRPEKVTAEQIQTAMIGIVNVLSGASSAPLTTDSIAEGTSNFYWTPARTRSALSAGSGLNFSEGEFSVKFGTMLGTVAAGNDSRILNGSTAYSWGNHADAEYMPSVSFPGGGTGWGGFSGLTTGRFVASATQAPSADMWYGLHMPSSTSAAAAQIAFRNNQMYFRTREDNVTKAWVQALTVTALTDSLNERAALVEPAVSSGTSAQYRRGDKTWQTLNTTAVPEGTNQYWTNARGDARYPLLSGSYANPSWLTSLPWSKITGAPSFESPVAAGTTAQYYRGDKGWADFTTAARASVSAGTGLSYSSGVFSANFGTAAGTIAQGNDTRLTNGQTAFGWGNHASAGYVPGTRIVTAGLGLTGGGGLSGDISIAANIGTASGTVAAGNDSRIVNGQTAYSWGNHASVGYVNGTRTVNAGSGLIGGGALSDNVTISANFGTASGTVAQGNDSRIVKGQTAFGWGDHSSAGYELRNTNVRSITTAAPFTITNSDHIIFFSGGGIGTGGGDGILITLPDPTTCPGRELIFWEYTGSAWASSESIIPIMGPSLTEISGCLVIRSIGGSWRQIN